MDISDQCSEIFYEAQVIDVDFSQWDRFIRFVTIGMNCSPDAQGRSRVFNVDFTGVGEFSWRGKHLSVKLDDLSQHCQWSVFKSKFQKTEEGYRVWLGDVSPPSPEVTILCQNIEISSISWDDLFRANPEWHGSHLPLIRPSLVEVAFRKRESTQ